MGFFRWFFWVGFLLPTPPWNRARTGNRTAASSAPGSGSDGTVCARQSPSLRIGRGRFCIAAALLTRCYGDEGRQWGRRWVQSRNTPADCPPRFHHHHQNPVLFQCSPAAARPKHSELCLLLRSKNRILKWNQQPELWIRIHWIRIRIGMRIQHFRWIRIRIQRWLKI